MYIFDSLYISVIGIVYLFMLFIPNVFWMKHKPIAYNLSHENKFLLICERAGQILVCFFIVVIFNKTNSSSFLWLGLSFLCMILYECFWIRYFRSDKQPIDFYCSFFKIPILGASLPIIAFGFLGIYYLSIPLLISVFVFGVGHIGIHLQHLSEINQ